MPSRRWRPLIESPYAPAVTAVLVEREPEWKGPRSTKYVVVLSTEVDGPRASAESPTAIVNRRLSRISRVADREALQSNSQQHAAPTGVARPIVGYEAGKPSRGFPD